MFVVADHRYDYAEQDVDLDLVVAVKINMGSQLVCVSGSYLGVKRWRGARGLGIGIPEGSS